jgi:hypothetical protein
LSKLLHYVEQRCCKYALTKIERPSTKLELSEGAKIYDIIFPGFQVFDDAICYISEAKSTMIFLIYP